MNKDMDPRFRMRKPRGADIVLPGQKVIKSGDKKLLDIAGKMDVEIGIQKDVMKILLHNMLHLSSHVVGAVEGKSGEALEEAYQTAKEFLADFKMYQETMPTDTSSETEDRSQDAEACPRTTDQE